MTRWRVLRLRREGSGLTRQALADLAGLSVTTIKNAEMYLVQVSARTWAAIERVPALQDPPPPGCAEAHVVEDTLYVSQDQEVIFQASTAEGSAALLAAFRTGDAWGN